MLNGVVLGASDDSSIWGHKPNMRGSPRNTAHACVPHSVTCGGSAVSSERFNRTTRLRQPDLPLDFFVCEFLAELDAPLIERIYAPDDALHKHLVLIESNELAKDFRGQLIEVNRIAGPVAFVNPIGLKVVVGAGH